MRAQTQSKPNPRVSWQLYPIILDILSCLFSAPLSLYYTPQGNAVVDVLCKVNDPVVARIFIISSLRLQQLSARRL